MENVELILSLTPFLTHLKLISSRTNIDSAFNGAYWERIIETKLSLLKKFEIFFSYHSKNRDTVPTLESLITPFQTLFWYDKMNCYFSADIKLSDTTVQLYSTPVCVMRSNYNQGLICKLSSRNDTYSLIYDKSEVND